MWRTSLSVSTASPTAPQRCRMCIRSVTALLLTVVDGDRPPFHLHPQCASPALLRLTLPLAAIERIDGYDDLRHASPTDSECKSLLYALRPALTPTEEEKRQAGASEERQPRFLANPNPPASVICPECQLLLHEPVSMPCCGHTLCALCWKEWHLAQRTGRRVTLHIRGRKFYVGCRGCRQFVHVGAVEVDQGKQERLDRLLRRCPQAGCTERFRWADRAAHLRTCHAEDRQRLSCDQPVRRRDTAHHALTCAGGATADASSEEDSDEEEEEDEEEKGDEDDDDGEE